MTTNREKKENVFWYDIRNAQRRPGLSVWTQQGSAVVAQGGHVRSQCRGGTDSGEFQPKGFLVRIFCVNHKHTGMKTRKCFPISMQLSKLLIEVRTK